MSSTSEQQRDDERESGNPERQVTIRPLEAAVVVLFVGVIGCGDGVTQLGVLRL